MKALKVGRGILFYLILSGLMAEVAQGQIFTIDFSTTAPNQIINADTGITVSNVGISSANITYNSLAGTFGGTPFAQGNGGWTADSAAAAKNFHFTITAVSGYTFDLTGFESLFLATNAGPSAVSLIINDTVISTQNAGGGTNDEINEVLASLTELQSATIKIAGWDNESRTTSGGGDFRIAAIQGFGTINAPSAIYWDGASGWTATGPGAGGNGTWSNATTGWDAAQTGQFGGTAGTVTVDGTVNVNNGLVFATTGYVLTGGTLNFGGATTADNAVTTGSGVTATIGSALTSTQGLTTTGSGTLNLAGDLSGLTEGVVVQSGTTNFTESTNLPKLSVAGGTATVQDGTEVTLTAAQLASSGGTLNIDGTLRSTFTGASWTAPSGSVVVGSTGTVVQQGNASATSFLFSGNVTWEEGSTFIFRDWTFTPAVSNRVYDMNLVFESTGSPMNVSLGTGGNPWTVQGSLTIGENVSFSYGSFTGGVNYNGDVIVAGTLGATVAAPSFTILADKELIMQGSGTLNIATGQTVTINQDGGVRKTGTGTATIAGGTLFYGGPRDFVVEDGTLVISSDIDGTGGVRLVKLGAGTLVLDGDKTGGSVRIGVAGAAPEQGGTVRITSAGALGPGQLQFNYGTLEATTNLAGASAVQNDVSIGGRVGAAAVFGGTNAIEIAGETSFFRAAGTSGEFALNVLNDTILSGGLAATSGGGTATGVTLGGGGSLTLSGDGSAFTDRITVASGTLVVANTVGNATGGDVVVANGGVIAGGGSIGGDLTLEAGAEILFTGLTLTVSGEVSLDSSFGVLSLIGLDENTAIDEYEIFAGTSTDFSTLGIQNWGFGERVSIGGDREAYFKDGSLTLVVIPEPGTLGLLLGAGGLLAVLRRRRKISA